MRFKVDGPQNFCKMNVFFSQTFSLFLFTDVVKQKENEILQKTEEVAKIKAEMQKLKATMKKSSVLNLEVEAYEKSLTEVSLKYESTMKQLSEAKTEIDSYQATIKKLNADIQSLTNQLELEKQNSSGNFQNNFSIYKCQILILAIPFRIPATKRATAHQIEGKFDGNF